jgi:hypothetical protein
MEQSLAMEKLWSKWLTQNYLPQVITFCTMRPATWRLYSSLGLEQSQKRKRISPLSDFDSRIQTPQSLFLGLKVRLCISCLACNEYLFPILTFHEDFAPNFLAPANFFMNCFWLENISAGGPAVQSFFCEAAPEAGYEWGWWLQEVLQEWL